MVYGCGIDIEEIDRFIKISEDPLLYSAFAEDVFNESELRSFDRNNIPLYSTAAFSIKEAFFKSVGKSWTNSGLYWKDVSIIFSGDIDTFDLFYSENLQKRLTDIGITGIEAAVRAESGYTVSSVILFR